MRKPTEAEFLQGSAIVVAAPRYMGAFASAIGIDVLAYWPFFAKIEIGSGAAMAILEGWAVAFMFRKWRTMQAGTPHWWVLLVLQVALMLALPATATPYLISSQLGQDVNQILTFWPTVAWSFVVAAIAPLVLAAVGYADVETKENRPTESAQQVAELEARAEALRAEVDRLEGQRATLIQGAKAERVKKTGPKVDHPAPANEGQLPDRLALILDLAQAGKGPTAISKETGIPLTTVKRGLKELNGRVKA